MANPHLRRNRLIINEMYRKRNTFTPVIPGSSIKGALRTAVIAYIMKQNNGGSEENKPYHGDPWSFEKDILKYRLPQNDPFRTLLVRDAWVQGSDIGYVSRIDQYKKGGVLEDSLNTIPINVEIIRGKLTGSSAIAPTELLFDKALRNVPRFEKWNGFSVSIDWELIRKACNDFYYDSFNDEYNNFYLSCDDSGIIRVIEELKKEIDGIIKTATACVARIGRFSQIESMTVPARNPKKKYGSTRSLVRFRTGLYPLGWVCISLKEEKKNEGAQQGAKRDTVRKKGE
jgi:CRISPR-associated protein Csm5